MTSHGIRFIATAALAALGGACSSGSPEVYRSGDSSAPLALGSRGPAVRALYDYLSRYGYFENPALRSQYPNWQPVVSDLPADPEVFDDVMQDAVLEYQKLMGIEQTGVVNAKTAELIATPRCGRPDVDVDRLDESRKFDMGYYEWSVMPVTYEFNDHPLAVSGATWRQYVTNALNRWVGISELTFQEDTNPLLPSDISFNIAYPFLFEPTYDLNGWAYLPPDGAIFFNDTHPDWTNQVFAETVAGHEIGHALGLEHSKISGALMYPTAGSNPNPQIDDIQAIGVKYGAWATAPGAAKDLSGSPTGGFWAIGTNPHNYTAGNFSIHFWTGGPVSGNWTWDDPSTGGFYGGGIRIAAQTTDRAWVVTAQGTIWRRVPPTGWVQVTQAPVPAVNIAFSQNPSQPVGNGNIWYVGTDHNVYVMTVGPNPGGGERFNIVAGTGAANAVAAGPWPYSSAGPDALYVLQTNGRVVKRVNGDWSSMPELPMNQPNNLGLLNPIAGPALDIAVGGDGSLWAIGGQAVTNGHQIYIYNRQLSGGPGTPPPAAKNEWIPVGGGAERVGVNVLGTPWVAQSTGVIKRRKRE